MGCQNKSKFSNTQIDVIKKFRSMGVNILKHKKIYGIFVVSNENKKGEFDDIAIGFSSVPLDEVSYEDIVEDETNRRYFGIIGDKTIVVDENFDIEFLKEVEEGIKDTHELLPLIQEAVESGLCEYDKEIDIIFLDYMNEFCEDETNITYGE